jgi:hypothetical protein
VHDLVSGSKPVQKSRLFALWSILAASRYKIQIAPPNAVYPCLPRSSRVERTWELDVLRLVALCTLAASQWLLKSSVAMVPGGSGDASVVCAAVPRPQLHRLVDLIAHIGARRGKEDGQWTPPSRANPLPRKIGVPGWRVEKEPGRWASSRALPRNPHPGFVNPYSNKLPVRGVATGAQTGASHERFPPLTFSIIKNSPVFRQHEVPTEPHHPKP